MCDHVGIGFDDIVVTLGLVSKAQAQIAVDKQALLGIDDGTHERNHVHRLKVERSRAVFHARQVEHLLHQTSQATRLGSNSLQVLIVGRIYAILHGLDRCEHGHKRSTKFVSHVRGQTFLVFHILLERSGHLIEGLTQLIDLVITAQSRASRQVAVTDLLCGTGDAMNRLGEHARHERSDNDRNADCNNRGEGHGVKGLLPKRRVRLGEQSVGADGPQLYLSDMLAGRRYDFDVSNAIGVGWSRRDRAMRCFFTARAARR